MDAGLVVNTPSETLRNPGPSWGYNFVLWAEHRWPRWIFRPAFLAGNWVALAFMPEQRAHSRAYLTVVLGRPPSLREVWRHFVTFAEFLLFMLRAGRGVPVDCQLQPENRPEFNALVQSRRPAIFGTFHFGCSDLLGFMLGPLGCQASIIRQRVGNSADTDRLGERFGDKVSFLWVNDPANLLFELKAALEAGQSLAMKCDRLEFSAKTEPFRFLGADRLFPFTIYHLALLFDRPVVFCIAVPADTPDAMLVYASPVFVPVGAAGRAANLQAAREHFQGVLARLETLVRQQPMLWFNFRPLNPEAVPVTR